MKTKFPCPVCGNLTLDEERMFDICDVCGWEDDNIQFNNPDYEHGANFFSLNHFKELYLQGKNAKELSQKARDEYREKKKK